MKLTLRKFNQCGQDLLHFDDYDATVTTEEDVGLLIHHADCQATIFYDPIDQLLGNIHCGWRGSIQNIYQKMVDKMTDLYQTDPSDLIVCIGPNSAEFKHYKEKLLEAFWEYQICSTYFDFWEISRMQLTSCWNSCKSKLKSLKSARMKMKRSPFLTGEIKTLPHQGTLVGILSN
ncbi:MAG: polyphenol oxidase family protein [Candidatus Neptunochlamydia sp.]|nr:polyphenol oxidase family protein [Candidatus Neptunochlamydia sp.]